MTVNAKTSRRITGTAVGVMHRGNGFRSATDHSNGGKAVRSYRLLQSPPGIHRRILAHCRCFHLNSASTRWAVRTWRKTGSDETRFGSKLLFELMLDKIGNREIAIRVGLLTIEVTCRHNRCAARRAEGTPQIETRYEYLKHPSGKGVFESVDKGSSTFNERSRRSAPYYPLGCARVHWSDFSFSRLMRRSGWVGSK